MAKRILPTPEQLRQLLRYEPETGKLFWKKRPLSMFTSNRAGNAWNSRFAGKEALSSAHNTGYFCGGILGKVFLAHRVAWAVYYGEWPREEIDHINGDRKDNRISNLREASRLENSRNAARRSDNSSGLKGVGVHKGQWRARMRIDGKSRHLGYFPTPEAAHAAYCEAAKKYHGEFARTQ